MRSLICGVFLLTLALMAGACSSIYDTLPTTPDPVIVTDVFTGTITINGAASHPFFTGATGTVTATLSSLGETPPAMIGFSLGTYSGTTCSVTSITNGLFNDKAVVNSVVQGTVSTLGGSLCQRNRCWYFRDEHVNCLLKGGRKCPAQEGENEFHAIFTQGHPCVIVHPSTLAPPLIALGATAEIVGPKGKRELPVEKMFRAPVKATER